MGAMAGFILLDPPLGGGHWVSIDFGHILRLYNRNGFICGLNQENCPLNTAMLLVASTIALEQLSNKEITATRAKI